MIIMEKATLKKWLKLGVNVIPLEPRGKRPPEISPDVRYAWKVWQTNKVTEKDIDDWFETFGSDINYGIVCGEISGRLVIVDLDDKSSLTKIFNPHKLSKNTIVGKTQRGWHIYLRTKKLIKSQKIMELGIDIQSEGKYVVGLSSMHPAGMVYKQLGDTDKIMTVADFTKFFWEKIADVPLKSDVVSKRKWPKPKKPYEGNHPGCIVKILAGLPKGTRNEGEMRLVAYALKYRQMQRAEAKSMIEDWNKGLKDPLPENELLATFNSVSQGPYSYTCTDWLLNTYCTGRDTCPLFGALSKKVEIFSKETLEKAEKVLEGDPFKFIVDTVHERHAGDDDLIVADWISALSARLTKTKINTWAIGESGKGKSHVKESVTRILPMEMYEILTSASPKSFYYLEDKHGKNAIADILLYIDEIEASQYTLPMLRSLTGQTDIKPRHLTIVDGKVMDITIQGGRAVWFTSVQTFGSEQIQNRFLHFNPDESPEQDDRVRRLQEKIFVLGEEPDEAKFKLGRAVTKVIVEKTQDLKVKYTFMPKFPFKVRRFLYPMFIAFITIIAKIRFKHRKIENGYLYVEEEDFNMARDLWLKFEKYIVYRVSTQALILFDVMPAKQENAMTRAELQKAANFATSKTRRMLGILLEAKLINEALKEGVKGMVYWKAGMGSIEEAEIEKMESEMW